MKKVYIFALLLSVGSTILSQESDKYKNMVNEIRQNIKELHRIAHEKNLDDLIRQLSQNSADIKKLSYNPLEKKYKELLHQKCLWANNQAEIINLRKQAVQKGKEADFTGQNKLLDKQDALLENNPLKAEIEKSENAMMDQKMTISSKQLTAEIVLKLVPLEEKLLNKLNSSTSTERKRIIELIMELNQFDPQCRLYELKKEFENDVLLKTLVPLFFMI